MNGRVLICDDSIAVHRSLARYLKSEGIVYQSAFSGEEALKLVKSTCGDRRSGFDIIILDIMLPGINGLDVCREIRKVDQNVYVMMLSAKGEVTDRVVGLEIGADDYVVKPFSPKEVAIRIRKILNRLYPKKDSEVVEFEDISINPDSYQAVYSGGVIELSSKETGVLLYLIKNVGRAVSRDQLIENIWGYDYEGDERTVDSLMKRLKQKLQDNGINLNIKSVYGVGYRLDRRTSKGSR